MKRILFFSLFLLGVCSGFAQEYFYGKYTPFQEEIPSPEAFLGYPIGSQHTRHDMLVMYLKTLAERSDRATIIEYGKTHEGRPLVILNISSPGQLNNLEALRQRHLASVFGKDAPDQTLPAFVNLGYNVHGNEPSSAEAAMLAAYTLVASEHPNIERFREEAVIFIDPVINPDGRDRHTQWANSFKGTPLVADPQDAEHNEMWPGGRTNHYWFDLNRDWLLAINPESRGKLNWYHQWYPNVVTDFHEMGTRSTYFFEPMKDNGSKDPIMPKENYEDLNLLFAGYYADALDSIGSLYFTKEVFDGTYPGYGSSYPDIQGGLGILFEQASSRGHVQNTPMGEVTFPFTIRNQYTSSITTVAAAVDNKALLQQYQQDFFNSALSNAAKNKITAYSFKEENDLNRLKAFLDKLLIHRVEVYRDAADQNRFIVPAKQQQYRMVQTVFETYSEYRDSVFYDASAWSLANFYNIAYKAETGKVKLGDRIQTPEEAGMPEAIVSSQYAYLIDWQDYNTPAALNFLQEHDIRISSAYKGFTTAGKDGSKKFGAGTLVIPVASQEIASDSLYGLLKMTREKFRVPVHGVTTGYHGGGIDLGSNYVLPMTAPKAFMLIGNGARSYEAGEVWHLLDTRVHMPITKISTDRFNRADLSDYNTMVMVSGDYALLDSLQQQKIADWVAEGNTLVAIGSAVSWLIKNKMIKEELIEKEKDTSPVVRKPYITSREETGKTAVGGAIFKVELDLTHPLAFGYSRTEVPMYKNNSIWLKPGKNPFSTVAVYPEAPHLDGFITAENLEKYLQPSSPLLVSKLGRGRVVLFASNPNFRGSWYGTDKLFLNALFHGSNIRVP